MGVGVCVCGGGGVRVCKGVNDMGDMGWTYQGRRMVMRGTADAVCGPAQTLEIASRNHWNLILSYLHL